MALTLEEAEELRRLERELADESDAEAGRRVFEAVDRQKGSTAPKARSFSIYRAGVGGLRDAAQGVFDTSQSISSSYRGAIAPYVGDSIAQVLSGDYFLPWIGRQIAPSSVVQQPTGETGIELPHLEGEQDAGFAERFARGAVSFLVPYAGWAKALGVARGASWLGRAGRALLAGGATDFTQDDPVSGNMANMFRDVFGLKATVVDALAADDDDSSLEQRFKAAAAGAPLGLAADALIEIGAKGIRAYKAWKGTAEEADEIVKSIRTEIELDPSARNLAQEADDIAVASDTAAAGPKATRSKKPKAKSGNVEPQAPKVNDFEDVLDYLKRQAGDPKLDTETTQRLAQNLLFGDPENALAKIGIDPVKLDFSKFDDPDTLGRLQRGMAELYETYAARIGRSNFRVTEAATVSAARAFASTADVLKSLHGSTANLAEELMGARMFVGAHAHKLLALADQAMIEIKASGAGERWAEFLEAFHRHAYYLGAVRGAGSEVGRALRSLQTLARVNPKKAARAVEDVIDNEAKDAGRELGMNRVLADASDYAARLESDADKLLALSELKALEGDVGALSRHVRRENFGILRRVDRALKETVGNLFSVGTASYNIASGATILGSRVLTRSMSTLARLSLVPFSRDAGIKARVAFMDTWAYTHGIVSGFGDAFSNALKMLEKEGTAELSLNADSLGLSGLAKELAARSADASAKLGAKSFERVDTRSYRSFAMSSAERRKLRTIIGSTPGPKFFQEGLAALARVAAVNVNALGSLSRAGTTLFINVPDQLVGTLAARAGAYSYAVRTAANEAVELGLDGRELSAYLKARTVQLAEHPLGWHPDGYDAGVREAMGNVGEAEAREVLFQDDLELSQGIARIAQVPLLHLVVPFVKTPLRILERTAIDYTPLGLLKDRVRKAILAGGPERDEALARLSLGILAVSTAFALADDRRIVVGNDGSYTSSARLGRPSYSVRVGDDVYEFSRLDPLGTLLGMGADLRAYFRTVGDDPDAPGVTRQAFEVFVWAVAANMLSKTWLTSLRNLTELAGVENQETFNARMDGFLQSFAIRFIPASGIQRQTNRLIDPYLREAMSFSDELLKNSIGAPALPVRRDALLGRPVPFDEWDRLVGLRAGVSINEDADPLAAELERLSFKIPGSRRSIEGVKLTAAQYSRLLELKGQVVRSPETGMTLEETLEALIQLPEYQAMNDFARVGAIKDEMDGFSRLATDQLLREDDEFAMRFLQQETTTRGKLLNWTRPQIDEETRRLAEELGLTPKK